MFMANRIDRTFASLKRRRKKALIGYITGGHPTLVSMKTIVPLLERAGLDLLEIGVPFSDPIADGPTIQRSSQVALENGTTLAWILQTVRGLRRSVQLPMVLMSYSNPIFSMGVAKFFRAAAEAGVDGVIIPDLILEESSDFAQAARRSGVHLIFLVAPTTPPERIRKIAAATRGFLYAVSLTGVTGARTVLARDVAGFLKTVRRLSKKPVAVGFGLSTPMQVRAIAPFADGVIVGSALVKCLEGSVRNHFRQATQFVGSLRSALDHQP